LQIKENKKTTAAIFPIILKRGSMKGRIVEKIIIRKSDAI
jgi:hypothetical protein